MRRILGLFLCVMLFSAPAVPEQKPMLSSSNYVLDHPNLARKVSLALNDTNIVDALIYLSEKAEINVAVSKTVEGRATLSLNDVSIRDALDIILLSNDLAMEKRGDIFYVMPAEDYENLHGESWSEARQIQMYKLKYARPADVAKVLDTLKSRVGSVVIDQETGTIVVMDTPEKIRQIGQMVDMLDHERVTKVISLKYATAKDVQVHLADRLDGKGVGTIKADEKSNRVIVTALPGAMEEVEATIAQLDTKTKQVLIDAKIIEVELTPSYESGVDWQKLLARATLGIDSQFPADTLSRFGTLTVSQIGPMDIDLVMKLVRTVGEAKLLSRPRITALNNEEAKIFVGTRDFYTTSTSTATTGAGTSTAVEINFIDVGVTFKVTPIINDDGFVLMKIKPEVSRVDRTVEISTGDLIPVIDTTNAETRVMVKDGNTLIIGGLIRDTSSRNTQQFPVLGGLPVVGHLFKHVREDVVKSEIAVFMTPHIIDAGKDMQDFDRKQPKPLRGYDHA